MSVLDAHPTQLGGSRRRSSAHATLTTIALVIGMAFSGSGTASADVPSLGGTQVDPHSQSFSSHFGPADPPGCSRSGSSTVPFASSGLVKAGAYPGTVSWSGTMSLGPQTMSTVGPYYEGYGYAADYGPVQDLTGTFSIVNAGVTTVTGEFTGVGPPLGSIGTNVGSCYGEGPGDRFGYENAQHGGLQAVDAAVRYRAVIGDQTVYGDVIFRSREQCVVLSSGHPQCGYSGLVLNFVGASTITPPLTATTTELSTSGSPSTQGEPVTFIATVTPGSAHVPTGSVTFTPGDGPGAVVPLDPAGRATWTTSDLPLGTTTVTAAYGGDASSGASSTSLAQEVGPRPRPPAGRILFHTFTSSYGATVWSVGVDGSPKTAVDTGGHAEQPSWSRSGHRFAFMSMRDGGQQRSSEIYTADFDGSDVWRVTANATYDAKPAWSPNGTSLAFQSTRDGNLEVYRARVDGGALTRLTTTADGISDGEPSWSPTGEQIAFTRNEGRGSKVWVMGADGGNQRLLTPAAGQYSTPAWSPDGTQIAYTGAVSSNTDVYVHDLASATQTRLTTDPGYDSHPTWSPDGTWIAFGSEQGGLQDIWAMQADGRHAQRITHDAAGESQWTWGPAAPGPLPARSLTVAPASGLDPAGTTVQVTGAGYTPGTTVLVAQCNGDSCGESTAVVPDEAGSFSLLLAVSGTYGGRCDPGLCALRAASHEVPADTESHPLEFDLPAPVPALTIVDGSDLPSAATVTVQGSGYVDGQVVELRQCETEGTIRCGPPVSATAGTDGTFVQAMPVSLSMRADWLLPCIACVVREGSTGPAAPIDFAPWSLTVGEGPFSGAGQLITLTGHNLIPLASPLIYACDPTSAKCLSLGERAVNAEGVLSLSAFLDDTLSGTLTTPCNTACYLTVVGYDPPVPLPFTRTPANPESVETSAPGSLAGDVDPGTTVTTGSTPSEGLPVAVTLTSTTGGLVSIESSDAPAPTGFSLLGSTVQITAEGTPDEPVVLTFVATLPTDMDIADVLVERRLSNDDVQRLADCTPEQTTFPDPCVRSRTVVDGNAVITVVSPGASSWQLLAAIPNTAPVAEDVSVSTLQGRSVDIPLLALDADGDPLTFVVTAGPDTHGTVKVQDSTATYVPDSSYSGPASFTVAASDGTVSSSPATVHVTVSPDIDRDGRVDSAPLTATECRNGGWASFSGPTFKNQGACVSSTKEPRFWQADGAGRDGQPTGPGHW